MTYADTIFTNAAVYTADPANPRAEAVAVRGNRIVFRRARRRCRRACAARAPK
jgi:predicted amidohydrolase YtcJ